jgi:hypothetical protein
MSLIKEAETNVYTQPQFDRKVHDALNAAKSNGHGKRLVNAHPEDVAHELRKHEPDMQLIEPKHLIPHIQGWQRKNIHLKDSNWDKAKQAAKDADVAGRMLKKNPFEAVVTEARANTTKAAEEAAREWLSQRYERKRNKNLDFGLPLTIKRVPAGTYVYWVISTSVTKDDWATEQTIYLKYKDGKITRSTAGEFNGKQMPRPSKKG